MRRWGGNPPPKAVRKLRGIYKQVYVAMGRQRTIECPD
jgi:hypothetical protein